MIAIVPWEYEPVENLWLSPRTVNALINRDIHYYKHLMEVDLQKLITFKWIWRKALKEISNYRDTSEILDKLL